MFLELGDTGVYNVIMEEEKKCINCHKPLGSDYQFCPYCGTLNSIEHESLIPESSNGTDENDSLDKLDVLEACLDVLDSEISKFLASHTH